MDEESRMGIYCSELVICKYNRIIIPRMSSGMLFVRMKSYNGVLASVVS